MHIENTTDTETDGHCWMCTQASGSLENHRMDVDIFERTECAQGKDGKVGVKLCPMCHTAVHRWMRSHGHESEHPGADALDAVFNRFTDAILGKTTRKGRKKS